MLKDSENDSAKTLDYLVAHLLDFFRDPKNEHNYLEAAKIAMKIAQPSEYEAAVVMKRFKFFSTKLVNSLSPPSLRGFAKHCLDSLKFSTNKNDLAAPSTSSAKHLRKNAERELTASLSSGHSSTAAIERAANVLLKNKRRLDAEMRIKKLREQHPLKDTLEVLNPKSGSLAREDIKNQFLRLKRDPSPESSHRSNLFRLLERAQAFSTIRLYHLLGDELFFLCRPLGFLDQDATILLVEVPTSAHLHALTYRKLEILKAVKIDPAFKSVKHLRFKIKNGSF